MSDLSFYIAMVVVLLISQGFFAMFEMSAVSFNKIRLQYYVKKNKRTAILLSKLIAHPARLFGTSLIMINTCLQFGSEYSRRLYATLGLNPALSPITQVILVLLFAELCPMFAARRHPHKVALFCVPFAYLVSLVLLPCTYLVMGLNYLLNFLFGKTKSKTSLFLSKDELQRAFEDQSTGSKKGQKLITKFFALKDKEVKDVMLPLDKFKLVNHKTSIRDLMKDLKNDYVEFVLLYHKHVNNVIGIIEVRDMIFIKPDKQCIQHSMAPWFISQSSNAIDVLHQFKHNNRINAIVTDHNGSSIGVITLNLLINLLLQSEPGMDKQKSTYFEQTISASISLAEFNERFHTHIEAESATIGAHVAYLLNHTPKEDDRVLIENLEITVSGTSFLGAEKLTVKTIQ